uniref:Uncharacterized protein LOC111104349 isoform X1 n=1 Tax=Crassostrea virginica TaxID=6565 RepID=A0A8B8AS02_CRAVI|nr:uncharacterized protein LOC111104349 isoform X1 [Crassostrea virginica]XP_022293956.1 uncharacterized protein LOC111104349 isoform X1 [Crassostrea virginica]XP_022293957.1 uncharacterized protein LOC111104349 isoform X1 [Crassostrea virginica]
MAMIDACPKNLDEIKNASANLECGFDRFGNSQYVCLPNTEKSSLIEFCYEGLMGLKEKGNCLEIADGKLVTYSCKHFICGCPTEPVRSNEFYKYQACQTINTRHQCYRFDPACPQRNHDNNGISYGIPEGSQNIIIYSMISVILALIVTSIILAYLLWKKNKATTVDHQILEESAQLIGHFEKDSTHGMRQRSDDIIMKPFEVEVDDNSHLVTFEKEEGHNLKQEDTNRRQRNNTETSIESYLQEIADEFSATASKRR